MEQSRWPYSIYRALLRRERVLVGLGGVLPGARGPSREWKGRGAAGRVPNPPLPSWLCPRTSWPLNRGGSCVGLSSTWRRGGAEPQRKPAPLGFGVIVRIHCICSCACFKFLKLGMLLVCTLGHIQSTARSLFCQLSRSWAHCRIWDGSLCYVSRFAFAFPPLLENFFIAVLLLLSYLLHTPVLVDFEEWLHCERGAISRGWTPLRVI